MAQQLRSLSAAKPAILDGDGAYYRGGVSPISRGIMVGGRGDYSHVGTFLWVDGELYIHECREFYGCRLVLAEREVRLCPARIDHHATNGTPAQRVLVRTRALSKLGKSYDWAGVWKASRYHVPLLRWTVTVDEDDAALTDFNDPEHCSYCRADLWAAAGRDLVPHLANRITEPNDLARSGLEDYTCTLVA